MTWGSWDNRGGNGMRIGINQSRTSVSSGSSSVKFTLKIYTENRYTYSDNQSINYSGAIGGSTSFHNGQGPGSKLRATKYYTYNYSDYGRAHSTSVTAKVPYSYNGSHPSVKVTLKIPYRPYSRPTAPTSFRSTSWTTTSVKLAWTRHASSKGPYTSQSIDWDYLDSKGNRRGYKRLATISGSATTFTRTGISTDQKIYFRIRSNNAAGSSGWRYFDNGPYYANTPSAPTNVKSTVDLNRSNITTKWTRNNKNTGGEISYQVQRQADSTSGPWTVVKTGLSATATSWIDSNPNAGYNRYQVRAVMGPYGPGNYVMGSAYASGNTISTIVPPLAPTQLAPNGKPADFSRDVTFKWRHNDGGDGSEQSHFTIEYSEDEGESWEELVVNKAKNASEYVIPADTLFNGTEYVWRVKTQGSTDKDFGPFSAVATVVGSSTPTVTIQPDSPPDPLEFSPLVVEWVFQQDEDEEQATWEATLLDESGDIIEAISGSGSTNDSDEDDDYDDPDPTDTDESVTFKSAMEDGRTYTARIRGQSSSGLWSDWDEVTFTVDLLPPAETTIDPLYDSDTGSMVLTVTAQPGHFEDWNLASNPSFEETDGMVDVRTNLAQNPSFENTSGTVDVWTNYIRNSSFKTTAFTDPWYGWSPGGGALSTYENEDGLTVLRLSPTIPVTGSPYTNSVSMIAPPEGSNITISGYFGYSFAVEHTFTLEVRWNASGGTPLRKDHIYYGVGAEAELTKYSIDVTVPVGAATFTMIGFYSGRLGEVLPNEYMDISRPFMSNSPEFFDGYTSFDSDLTPIWTGAVGYSVSKLVGSRVASVTASSQVIKTINSDQWADDGVGSLRIIRQDTPYYAAGGAIVLDLLSQFSVGQTVTFMAICHIPDGYNGSEDSLTNTLKARSLYVLLDADANSVTAPPVPGTYPLRLTVTITAENQSRSVRLGGGGAIGQSVYWDNLAIVEGDYDGEYFDGNYSPNSDLTPVWTGTPGASASKLVGTKVAAFRGNEDLRTVYQSNMSRSGNGHSAVVIGTTGGNSHAQLEIPNSGGFAGENVTVGIWAKGVEGPVTVQTAISVQELGAPYRTLGVIIPSNTVLPDDVWTEFRVVTPLPADMYSGGFRVNLYGGDRNWGNPIAYDDLMVVEGDYEGSYEGTFANAPVDSVDIQRRIDGGDWITILENLSMGHLEIYDEDFEDDPSGWIPNNVFGSFTDPASWDATTTKPFKGTESLEIAWANPTDGKPQNVARRFEDLTIGATYTIILKVWSNTPFFTTWIFNTGDEHHAGTSSWQTITHTFTATSDGHFFVIATASPTAGKTTFVDDIKIVSGTVHGYLEDEGPETLTVLDVIPSLTELNEYRMRVSSIAPSTALTEAVAADTSDQRISQWLFMNYSEGFTSVLRFRQDPEVSVAVNRSQSTPSILGRRRPLLLQGKSTSYEISVGGKLWYDALCPIDPKDQDSHPKEWETAQMEAEIICFRDNEGRRVFGALSDTDLATIITGHSSLGFKVTETFYEERPIELVQGVEI